MEKQTIGWMFMLSGKNGIVRVKVNFDDRFKDDKFYCDNEKITIVSDGVILNKSELFAKYKVTTLEDLLFLLLKTINIVANIITIKHTIIIFILPELYN